MPPIIVTGLVGLVALLMIGALTRTKHPAGLPPGPPPKPVIGNMRDLPSQDVHAWKHWLKHKELYGPISSVTVFGQTLIILNEARVALDLMEKRSAIYSSRPQTPMALMSGWGSLLGFLTYSDAFRTTRRNLHRSIGTNASVELFNSTQELEVGRFLIRLLDRPGEFVQHIRKEAGAIILKVGYGYIVEPHARDPLVELADKTIHEFSLAAMPGAWIVDFVPIMRYLPSWFPGTGFKQIAKDFKKNVVTFSDKPYEFVKLQMARGKFEPSFLSRLLELSQFEPGSKEEVVVKWSAASLYAGGSDTTVSTIACFFLAMVLYPETQKRAQAELDQVVGSSRLPTFEDRQRLPYINAMVKELLRWHPIAPMGVPHLSTDDDLYEGYYIPKSSILLPNVWEFTHNPDTYQDPLEFRPERFLSHDGHIPERDPGDFVYGFGRRACPGRILADANIYLTLAQSLAAFNISKAVRDGKEVDVQPVFPPGVVSHPAPFDCSIEPRSTGHEKLIRAIEKDRPWENSHADELNRIQIHV